MKTRLTLVLGIATLIIFSSFVLMGDLEKQDREVDSFTEIELRISADVYVTQGKTQKLTIEASKDDLEEIETVVSDNELTIKTESWRRNLGTVNIYITMPVIEGFDISGSGKIMAQNDFSVNDIELEVSGSGDIEIGKITAKDVDSEISGSGSITIKDGNCSGLDGEISGSGKIYAFGLKANKVDCEISGSGKCEITAVERLEADITGSGKIYYKGKPVINSDISGSGKIKSAE